MMNNDKMEINNSNLDLDQIKTLLSKDCVVFTTGGIRPTNEIGESWIGSVRWKEQDEDWPIDETGKNMVPLVTLFLEGLPFVPKALSKYKLLTIYVSNVLISKEGKEYMTDILIDKIDVDLLDKYFTFRLYENLDNIVACDFNSDYIKPFPLVPNLMKDYPMWEDESLDDLKIRDVLLQKEVDSLNYQDEFSCCDGHKLGGYPYIVQYGIDLVDGHEFVLQISSDSKAEINIVNYGNLYFSFNDIEKSWKVAIDFN